MSVYQLTNIPREQAGEIHSSVDGETIRIYATDKVAAIR